MIKYIRHLIVFLLAAVVSIPSQAEYVPREAAHEVASDFFNSAPATRSGNMDLKFIWDSNRLFQDNYVAVGKPSFYVFTPEDGDGFVIVSGDDSISPILGYSFDSSLSRAENLPPAMKAWLGCVNEMIRYRQDHPAAVTKAAEAWTATAASDGEEILLKTAAWNQYEPYNLQCPMFGGELCVTGCTATALAIAMKYHEWPKSGRGTTEPYQGTSVSVPVRDLNHEYDWDNMRMEYYGNQYTQEQADAVATLMADIGHAIYADYNPGGTGAAVMVNEVYDHFGYSPEIKLYFKDYYNDDEWNRFILSELKKNRPIVYSGFTEQEGGHAFIVDGYRKGMFHVNWGWGGSNDGYFSFNNLNSFDFYQDAVINMYPDVGGEIGDWLKLFTPGIFSDMETYQKNMPFYMNACIINVTQLEFRGKLRLALLDHNYEIREWISDEINFYLGVGGIIDWPFYNCMFTVDSKAGDRICAFYKREGSDEWELLKPDGSFPGKEIFVNDRYTIEESTSVSYDQETGLLTLKYKDGVECVVLINGTPCTEGLSSDANSMTVDVAQLPEKSFVVRLTKADELKEINFNIKPL